MLDVVLLVVDVGMHKLRGLLTLTLGILNVIFDCRRVRLLLGGLKVFELGVRLNSQRHLMLAHFICRNELSHFRRFLDGAYFRRVIIYSSFDFAVVFFDIPRRLPCSFKFRRFLLEMQRLHSAHNRLLEQLL